MCAGGGYSADPPPKPPPLPDAPAKVELGKNTTAEERRRLSRGLNQLRIDLAPSSALGTLPAGGNGLGIPTKGGA